MVRIQREPVLAVEKSCSRFFSLQKQIHLHLDRAQFSGDRSSWAPEWKLSKLALSKVVADQGAEPAATHLSSANPVYKRNGACTAGTGKEAGGLQRRNRVTTNYALASIRTSWRYIGRPNIRNREQIRFDTTRQAVFDE